MVFVSCSVWPDEATLNEASYPLVEEEDVELILGVTAGEQSIPSDGSESEGRPRADYATPITRRQGIAWLTKAR